MKYLLVVFLCCATACSDTAKKRTSFDSPDQGLDVTLDAGIDVATMPDTPDQSPDTPDMPIETSVGAIKVTTWNILCLRENPDAVFCNTDEFGNEFVRSPAQVEALREHALALGTDLLFLEEVENLAAVENLLPGWQVFEVGSSGQKIALAIAPGSSVNVRGVSELSELDLGSSTLRPGLVAQVDHDGISVRILAVHLKSGCQIGDLATANSSCSALRDQLAVLKSWITERESQNQPYMLVGDFNRTLENNDPFYLGLEDAAGKPLLRLTLGQRPSCWDHLLEAPSYPSFIDHIIMSPSIVAAWGAPAFDIYNYTETYPNAWLYVSDHCAITASFQ